MTWTRRDFLSVGLGTGLGLGLSPWRIPGWLASAAQDSERDRTLVILELTGGNDALNMIVPHSNDAYHQARPRLRIPPKQVLRLDDDFGLHPRMTGLRDLHDQGHLAIVPGVGYEQPNRSHFRALDIWHSATPEDKSPRTGWIGRAADAESGGAGSFAFRIGGRDVPLLLRSRRSDVPSLDRLSDYAWDLGEKPGATARRANQKRLLEIPRGNNSAAERVRRATLGALTDADRLSGAVRPSSSAGYSGSELARRLQLTAALLNAHVGPRVVYLNQGGYDTHANQSQTHADLLGDLSQGLSAFFTDLGQRRLTDQVLVMVYSEFGRRVAENASAGTDHGAAAPVLLLSGAIVPGFHGQAPSLEDLDDGDLRFTTDFRRLYATLLDPWLGVRVEPALGTNYAPLPIIA